MRFLDLGDSSKVQQMRGYLWREINRPQRSIQLPALAGTNALRWLKVFAFCFLGAAFFVAATFGFIDDFSRPEPANTITHQAPAPSPSDIYDGD